MSQQQKFRLVTRSDFDGLVCAVLLKQLELIEPERYARWTDRDYRTRYCYQFTLC